MVSQLARVQCSMMLWSSAIRLLLRRQRPTQVPALVALSHDCVESGAGPARQPRSSEVVAVPVCKPHDRLVGAGSVSRLSTQKGQQRLYRPHSAAQSCSRFCILLLGADWSSAARKRFPNHCWSVASPVHRNIETGPTNDCERSVRYVEPQLYLSHPSQFAGSRRTDMHLLAR